MTGRPDSIEHCAKVGLHLRDGSAERAALRQRHSGQQKLGGEVQSDCSRELAGDQLYVRLGRRRRCGITRGSKTISQRGIIICIIKSFTESFCLPVSDTLMGEQPYRYLTVDLMKNLRDDSLPIDVTRDDPVHRQGKECEGNRCGVS